VKGAYDLIKAAGGTEQEGRTLAAISQAESKGNPNAHNPNTKTGDNSYGLWQINMLGRMGPDRLKHFHLKSNEDLYDPATNARVALQMSREKGGYSDWSTYNHGELSLNLGDGKGQAAAA
jgi:soluble lytic murein transglycosylase-like protein